MVKSEVTNLDRKLIVKYPELGTSYVVNPFKGKMCTKMLAKLTKYTSTMFGGMLQGLMGQVEGETEEEKFDTISFLIGGALEGAFHTVDDEQFLDFFYDLFTETTKGNSVIDYDEEFSGENLVVAFDLARHIVMHNFKPVFQQLGIAALLKPKAQEESEDRG